MSLGYYTMFISLFYTSPFSVLSKVGTTLYSTGFSWLITTPFIWFSMLLCFFFSVGTLMLVFLFFFCELIKDSLQRELT